MSAMYYCKHTDYTGFMVLHQDEHNTADNVSAGHSLQVLLPNGEWHPIPPTPGALVVNIGDLYEVWANGQWQLTVHQVTKPPPGSAAASSPHLSIPFFTCLHNDTVVEAMLTCVGEGILLRYAPVRVPDHLLGKLWASNS